MELAWAVKPEAVVGPVETSAPICMDNLKNLAHLNLVVAPLLEGYWESVIEDFTLAKMPLSSRTNIIFSRLPTPLKVRPDRRARKTLPLF